MEVTGSCEILYSFTRLYGVTLWKTSFNEFSSLRMSFHVTGMYLTCMGQQSFLMSSYKLHRMEEECHEVAVCDSSVVTISFELRMARKSLEEKASAYPVARGPRGSGGPQNVRLLQFVLGPSGQDSILLTEGGILRMGVTSQIIKPGPDRPVAGARRRFIYATGYNRLV